jgi:hypothetical protein
MTPYILVEKHLEVIYQNIRCYFPIPAHDLDVVADIKKDILEWTEEVVRMVQGRIVKSI